MTSTFPSPLQHTQPCSNRTRPSASSSSASCSSALLLCWYCHKDRTSTSKVHVCACLSAAAAYSSILIVTREEGGNNWLPNRSVFVPLERFFTEDKDGKNRHEVGAACVRRPGLPPCLFRFEAALLVLRRQ